MMSVYRQMIPHILSNNQCSKTRNLVRNSDPITEEHGVGSGSLAKTD
jgi:hypothetical protein